MEEICALDVAIRDLCLRIRLPDLPVHPLHHGLQAAVFRMEYFDKLLGTDLVGQGQSRCPEPPDKSMIFISVLS